MAPPDGVEYQLMVALASELDAVNVAVDPEHMDVPTAVTIGSWFTVTFTGVRLVETQPDPLTASA
jgi:putative Mn2+ efflux pump MntP